LPPQRDPRETCRWEIRDTGGRLHARHIRLEPGRDGKSKDCVWERPDGRKGLGGTKTCDLPLYGAHTLATLAPGTTTVVTEGEPPRDALMTRGIPAVGTVTGAASIPSQDVLRVLLGYDVVCWPDADVPGRHHMERLAAQLRALGGSVRWFDPWPDATDGQDAADFTGAAEELRALVGAAAFESTAPPTPSAAVPGVLLAEVVPGAGGRVVRPRLP